MPMPRSVTVTLHLAADAPRRDADPAAVGAVLDGVADQVLKHAAQRRLVAEDRRQVGRDVDVDRDAAPRRSTCPTRAARSSISASTRHRPQASKRALARLDAGELEDLLDHLGEPPAFAAHQLAVLPDLRPRRARRRRRGCRRPSGSRRAASAARARRRRRTPSAAAPAAARGASTRTSNPMLAASTPRMLELTSRLRRARDVDGRLERARRMLHEQPPSAPALRVVRCRGRHHRSIAGRRVLPDDQRPRPRFLHNHLVIDQLAGGLRRLAAGSRGLRLDRHAESGHGLAGGAPRRRRSRERGEAAHVGDELRKSCSRTWNSSALASTFVVGTRREARGGAIDRLRLAGLDDGELVVGSSPAR